MRRALLGVAMTVVMITSAMSASAQEGSCVRLNVTPAGIVLGTTVASQVHIAQDTPGIVVGGANFAYHVIWESGFMRDGSRVAPVDDPKRSYTHVKFSDRCPLLPE